MRRGSHPREVRMKHLARAAALAAVLLAPGAALSAQRELPYTYQGTVRAVKAGALDLIIGVGEAVRVVHMRTQSATAVFGEGASIALGDLQPGEVVRADCRLTQAGLIVDKDAGQGTATKGEGSGPQVGDGGLGHDQHNAAARKQVLGIDSDPFPPSATARAMRTSPVVFARGLLDAVPESVILAYGDPED